MIHPSTGEWFLNVYYEPAVQEIRNTIQNGKIGPIEADRWYELGVVVNNDTLWVYWDNIEVLTQKDVSLFGLSN